MPPPIDDGLRVRSANDDVYESEWWREYYKPGTYTSFSKAFAYRINSNNKYLPKAAGPGMDKSPFTVRKHFHSLDNVRERDREDEVGFTDVHSRKAINPLSATAPPQAITNRITSLQQWLKGDPEAIGKHAYVLDEDIDRQINPPVLSTKFTPADKTNMKQWTLRQFYDNSLHPTIADEEKKVYEDALAAHVTSALILEDDSSLEDSYPEYLEYMEKTEEIGQGASEEGTLAPVSEYHRWATEEYPLMVTGEDLEKKRFQAYAKWLRGKSLFKQAKVDPEFNSGP